MKVKINSFVKRQTEASPFSHYQGSWEELETLVEKAPGTKVTPGYREGVVLVEVPPEWFFCGVAEVNEDTELKAVFSARRPGEEPFIQVLATTLRKLAAKYVQIVVYSHDVLAADGDAEHEPGTWEIISINARPTEGEEPLHPVTMMRNQLHRPGGAEAHYTSEQWAEAVRYWSTRANIG